jgi:putative acetyltransferase
VSKDTIVIRKIRPEDDVQVARAIRSVLIEMGVPKVGTAYADTSLDHMTLTYSKPRSRYYVIEKHNSILGGAGIAPLEKYEGNVCELQKMYFMPEARGKGLGLKMMHQCLEFARKSDFKQCYLETMPYMEDAKKLYKKVGFRSIDGPLGNTGHYSCTVWMIKDL